MSRPQLNREIKELAKSVPVPSYTYQISKKADLERIRNRAQRIYNDLIATGRKQSLKGFSKSQIANLVKDKQDALGIRARKAVQSTSDSFNQLAKIQAARNRRANKPEKMFEPDYDIVSAMEKLTLTPVSISFEKVSESSARIADSIESKYRLQISPDNSQIDLPTTLKIINNLVLLHTNERQLQQNDRIAISVQNPKTGYWASTGLRTVAFASTDEFVQLFFEKISSIIEYDGSLSLEDLVFTVRSNRTVNGGTRQNRVVNPEEDLHSKKSVFTKEFGKGAIGYSWGKPKPEKKVEDPRDYNWPSESCVHAIRHRSPSAIFNKDGCRMTSFADQSKAEFAGPGHYNTNNEFGENVKGFTMRPAKTQRITFDNRDYTVEASKEFSATKHRTPSAIIYKDAPGRPVSFADQSKAEFGGPGQYEVSKKFGQDVKSFRIGTRSEKRLARTVGPGEYEPDRAHSVTKTRTRSALIMSSAKARPESLALKEQAENVGPGQYDDGVRWNQNVKSFKIGERREEKIE